MSRSLIFTVGLLVASELNKDIKKISPFAFIASQLLFLKYSRDDEYQADSLGVEYSRSSGYSPLPMIDFFNSIRTLTTMSGGHALPNFLSTHPLTEKRIQRAIDLMALSDKKLIQGKEDYLKRLDGLVYGMNPRQGYRNGDYFVHPDLGFRMQIPSAWKMQNTPKNVTMAPKDGNAVITLSVESSDQSLDKYNQEKLNNFSNVSIHSQHNKPVNQMSACHTFFKITNQTEKQTQVIEARISSLRYRDMIFTFFAAAEEASLKSYQDDMVATILSFQSVSGSSQQQVKPLGIRMQTINQPQSLRSYLQNQKIEKALWEEIALLNAMKLTDVLRSGQLVKVVK
jgi:predicted Zn-dependent protease